MFFPMEIKHGKGGIIHGGSVSCTLQIAQAHPRGRKAPRKQDCQQPWEAGSWKNSTAPGHSRSWMVLDGIGWYWMVSSGENPGSLSQPLEKPKTIIPMVIHGQGTKQSTSRHGALVGHHKPICKRT